MLYKNTLPINGRNRHGNQSSLEDRLWIEKEYLPKLVGTVLYVGINYYTDFYHELVPNPNTFVTVDLDPKVAQFGSPYGHYIDDVIHFLETCNCRFNHISIFGLFGCGHSVVKDRTIILNILNKCYDNVTPGGTINFGTSTDTFSVEDSHRFIGDSKLKHLSPITSFVCKPSHIHSNVFMFWGAKSNEVSS